MSSRLQLDVRYLSLGRRHLVNAYEVKAGIGVIAGKAMWSMPERLACTEKMPLWDSICCECFRITGTSFSWAWKSHCLLVQTWAKHHRITATSWAFHWQVQMMKPRWCWRTTFTAHHLVISFLSLCYYAILPDCRDVTTSLSFSLVRCCHINRLINNGVN